MQTMVRALSRRQTHLETSQRMTGLLVLVAILLAFWLAARFMDRPRRARVTHRPRGLFFELCRAHRLKWSDRWLLWRVARRHRLGQPAVVFLSPELLKPRADTAAAEVRRLESLAQRLFGAARAR
jgi:hypothetical protein